MNAEVTQICSGYEDDELELIAGFPCAAWPTPAGPPRKSSIRKVSR